MVDKGRGAFTVVGAFSPFARITGITGPSADGSHNGSRKAFDLDDGRILTIELAYFDDGAMVHFAYPKDHDGPR